VYTRKGLMVAMWINVSVVEANRSQVHSAGGGEI